jgi:hypothetical protein
MPQLGDDDPIGDSIQAQSDDFANMRGVLARGGEGLPAKQRWSRNEQDNNSPRTCPSPTGERDATDKKRAEEKIEPLLNAE